MSDATGKVSYGFNAVNLATSVVEPGGHTTTFGYDDDDNRTTTTYPNGVAQRAAYDASGRLTSIDGAKGTTVLTRFAYDYARSGADTDLRHSVTDKDNRTTTYAYDALDRLIQAKTTTSSGSVVDDFRYGYDAVGNRTSETVRQSTLLGAKDVTTNATFNAADQLTLRARSATPTTPTATRPGPRLARRWPTTPPIRPPASSERAARRWPPPTPEPTSLSGPVRGAPPSPTPCWGSAWAPTARRPPTPVTPPAAWWACARPVRTTTCSTGWAPSWRSRTPPVR